MKKILLSLFAATLFVSLIGCSNSKKSGETSNETPEAALEETQTTTSDTKDAGVDAYGRVAGQMEQLGIELSEDQQRLLQETSGKYDFNSAGNAEQRKAMRQEYQQEMYNILTPEQQAVYDDKRQNRNQGGN